MAKRSRKKVAEKKGELIEMTKETKDWQSMSEVLRKHEVIVSLPAKLIQMSKK